MKMFKKIKAKPSFLLGLSLIAVIGFLYVIFSELNLFNVNTIIVNLTFIIVGVILLVEGNIIKLITNKLHGKTFFYKLFTNVVALSTIIIGIIGNFNILSDFFSIARIIMSILAIIAIIIELFVID